MMNWNLSKADGVRDKSKTRFMPANCCQMKLLLLLNLSDGDQMIHAPVSGSVVRVFLQQTGPGWKQFFRKLLLITGEVLSHMEKIVC